MAESTYLEIKKETQLANENDTKSSIALEPQNTTSNNNNSNHEGIDFLGVKFVIPSAVTNISNDISLAGQRIDVVIIDEVRLIR